MRERTVRSTRAWQGRIVGVRVDEVELADGRRTRREIVEHPGAVAIVAWDGARVALVRQWRHAAGEELIEIPAGTREPSEEPSATAERELAEEAGVSARTWEAGPAFFTAPGFCTEQLYLYLATGLAPDDRAAPDDETIEVKWLSLEGAIAAIDDGRIRDAKSIAGLLWAARRLGR
jgi:ADP-ribose pyrophosphatase